jgi:YHS domain-containing protein
MKYAILTAVLIFLSGCGTTRNVTQDGGDSNLMLRGYDPVAYFTQGKPVVGNPAIKAEAEGLTYRFASEEHRRLFVASPARYAPQYGGFCSNGLPYAIKAGGTPLSWKVVDGRLFIFGDGKARDYWELDQARNIQLGDKYWAEEARDAPWRLQSYKRWVFKVPHYKTGAQLETELQAKGGKS